MKSVVWLFLFISSLSLAQPARWEASIQPGSKLEILGQTNVNEFTCIYPSAWLLKTIHFSVGQNQNRFQLQDARLHLQAKGFDCGHNLMNRDLLELLQAEKHPTITIDFRSISPNSGDDLLGQVSMEAEVTLAGERNLEKVEVEAISSEDNQYHYRGRTNINLRNYQIDPPNKFMGMVRVDERVSIVFDLIFTLSSN